MMIRSQKILRSAKGQTCAFRFPGICQGGTETTVWAHLNGGRFGKGMGMKAHDVLGGHACFWCHAYLDGGHATHPQMDRDQFLECILGGVTETLVRLIVSGLVIVPMDAEKLSSERPAPSRKPKGQRKAIPKSDRPIPQRQNPWPAKGTRKIENRRSD